MLGRHTLKAEGGAKGRCCSASVSESHSFTNNVFNPVTGDFLFTSCTRCGARADQERAAKACFASPSPAQTDETIARLELGFLSRFRHSLDALRAIIDRANIALDESILGAYNGERTSESDRLQLSDEEQQSSNDFHQYSMRHFDLQCLHGESRVTVDAVELNSTRVEDFIVEKLFGGSADKHRVFINEMESYLQRLRCMFYHLRKAKHDILEPSFFQPVFTLFLERFVNRLRPNWTHSPGARMEYKLPLTVHKEDSNDPVGIELMGKPDIYVHEGDFDCSNAANIKFQVELKIPFGALFTAQRELTQNQLICELMGHRHTLSDAEIGCVGILTDLFCAVIAVNFHERPRHFYLCTSVVDAKDYLNYLALACCLDDESDFKALINSESSPSVSKDKQMGYSSRSKRSNSGANGTRSAWRATTGRQIKVKNTRTTAHKMISSKSHEAKPLVINFKSIRDDIELANRGLEEWYAEHFNLVCLTSENLEQLRTKL